MTSARGGVVLHVCAMSWRLKYSGTSGSSSATAVSSPCTLSKAWYSPLLACNTPGAMPCKSVADRTFRLEDRSVKTADPVNQHAVTTALESALKHLLASAIGCVGNRVIPHLGGYLCASQSGCKVLSCPTNFRFYGRAPIKQKCRLILLSWVVL